MLFKKILLAGAVALGACGAHAGAAAPDTAPLPVSAFFARSQFSGALLSPDGVNVALLLRGPGGNIVLATTPAAGGAARILAGISGISGMDLAAVHWVNNRRLVCSAAQREREEGASVASPGLHAINIDGSKRVQLVAHDWSGSGSRTPLPPNTTYAGAVNDDASSDVYVYRYDIFKEDFEGYTLFRLNT